MMQATMGEIESIIEGVELRRKEEHKEKLYIARVMLQYILSPDYGWQEGANIFHIPGYDKPIEPEEKLTDEELQNILDRMDNT